MSTTSTGGGQALVEWLLLAASVVLMIVCGVFVAGEFALLTADRRAVARAAEAGDRGARGVQKAFARLSTELAGVQVAITVTNLAIGFLAEPAIATLLHAPLRGIGVGGATDGVAVAVALVVSTLLTMVFGELVPKNLAIALPLATAKAVQAPVRAFSRAIGWPIRGFDALANRVLAIFGIEAQEELASARSPEELLSVVRHSQRRGTLAAGTATLLVRTLAFGGKHARDVLTPRPRMVTIDRDAGVAELLDLVRATGHSRLPVTGPRGLDEIAGVVELDAAIAVPAARRPRTPVGAIMDRAVEVPETLELNGVVAALREHRSQLAIVVDEYGGTAGLVTGEDLLEELVGELEDEHDAPAPQVSRAGDGYDVSALLRPDEVEQQTGLVLPTSGVYETLGGLVMHELGRLPQVGDAATVGDVRVTVLTMDGRRVDRVHVTGERA